VRGVQERRTPPPLSGPETRGTASRRLLLTAAVAAIVVAADQATKSWAVSRLSHGSIHVFWKLDFVLQYNSGAAFSVAQGWAPVIGAVAIVVVCVLLVAARHAGSAAISVALGLVVGGAIGNLSDRLFRSHRGGVVDFIAFHFWPTFNVADSCVVVGGILLAILLFRAAPARTVPDKLKDPAGATGREDPDLMESNDPGGNTPGASTDGAGEATPDHKATSGDAAEAPA
jgi:signal peptidase II